MVTPSRRQPCSMMAIMIMISMGVIGSFPVECLLSVLLVTTRVEVWGKQIHQRFQKKSMSKPKPEEKKNTLRQPAAAMRIGAMRKTTMVPMEPP